MGVAFVDIVYKGYFVARDTCFPISLTICAFTDSRRLGRRQGRVGIEARERHGAVARSLRDRGATGTRPCTYKWVGFVRMFRLNRRHVQCPVPFVLLSSFRARSFGHHTEK